MIGSEPLTNLVKQASLDYVTTQVNLYEAKTQLSSLVDRAARGEEIVIAKAGRPVARLTALTPRTEPRELGVWKGRIRIGKDFDEPLTSLFEDEAG